jgi:hypothetical protein
LRTAEVAFRCLKEGLYRFSRQLFMTRKMALFRAGAQIVSVRFTLAAMHNDWQ